MDIKSYSKAIHLHLLTWDGVCESASFRTHDRGRSVLIYEDDDDLDFQLRTHVRCRRAKGTGAAVSLYLFVLLRRAMRWSSGFEAAYIKPHTLCIQLTDYI